MGQAFFERLDRFVGLVGSTRPCEPPERNDELARVGERAGPPEGVLGGRAGLLELTGHRAAHQAVEVELEVGVVGGTDGVEGSPASCERLLRGGVVPGK